MARKTIPVFYAAAGGVVADTTGEKVLLLIRPSRDEVRLPKGHIEPGESPKEAAMREVSEESGYKSLKILVDLGEQLVAFPLGKRAVRRTEHYYLMQINSTEQTERPEQDAQFFPIWVTWEEALQHLTYAAEREWIHRAQPHLKTVL